MHQNSSTFNDDIQEDRVPIPEGAEKSERKGQEKVQAVQEPVRNKVESVARVSEVCKEITIQALTSFYGCIHHIGSHVHHICLYVRQIR